MESSFDTHCLMCYSNFLSYTLHFPILHAFFLLIDFSNVLFALDAMLNGDRILSGLVTPLYFLSPHLYVDKINEMFENQCEVIFNYNGTYQDDEDEEGEGEEEGKGNNGERRIEEIMKKFNITIDNEINDRYNIIGNRLYDNMSIYNISELNNLNNIGIYNYSKYRVNDNNNINLKDYLNRNNYTTIGKNLTDIWKNRLKSNNLNKINKKKDYHSKSQLNKFYNNNISANISNQKYKTKRLLYNNNSNNRVLQEEEEKDNTNQNTSDSEEPETLMMFQRFTPNERFFDIKFRDSVLTRVDYSFCVFNKNLIFIAIAAVGLCTILLISLFFIDTRNNPSIGTKIAAYILTNSVIILLKPLFGAIAVILVNRPLIYLYKSSFISKEYSGEEAAYCFVSLFVLIFYIILSYLFNDYMTTVFWFEKFPYNTFNSGDEFFISLMKILVGFKLTYDRMLGINKFPVINLIVGVGQVVRTLKALNGRDKNVNHYFLKWLRTFFALFTTIFMLIKLLNQYVNYFGEYTTINFCVEIMFILIVSIVLTMCWARPVSDEFLFIDKEEILDETLSFFYYVGNSFSLSPSNSSSNNSVAGSGKGSLDKKEYRDTFVDKILVGHRLRCELEECAICSEEIGVPDLRKMCQMLLDQFSLMTKDVKEEDEELAMLMKLIFLSLVDGHRLNRLAFSVLKSLKNPNLSFETMLKMMSLYRNALDELNNEDLKGQFTVKYDEVNEKLLQGIKGFEDVLGFVRTRTEKVELVTRKTNALGKIYKDLNKNLLFLRNSKKAGFDKANFLELTTLVRLLFSRQLDNELGENIDMSFMEFLEVVDKRYMDNMTIMLKYDFNNKTWRIKNVPKRFLEYTQFGINELLEQPLDKIFPKILAKSRVKQMEKEVIMDNVNDENLEFKTVICDKETNAKSAKFIINIVPNLEMNYSIYLRCHFHDKQLLIIDEFGNFVNGSSSLYLSAGLSAEVVQSSKGKINMFTVFGLDRRVRMEELRVANICEDLISEATKDLFLLGETKENPDNRNKFTTMPGFLSGLLKNNREKKGKKEEKVVFFKLKEKERVNDINYYIFQIKIDDKGNVEKLDKKLESSNRLNELNLFTPGGDTPGGTPGNDRLPKNNNNNNQKLSSKNVKSSKIMNDGIMDSENNPLKAELEEYKDNEFITNNNLPKVEDNEKVSSTQQKDKKDDEQKYSEYYKKFYDENGSTSVIINNKEERASMGSLAAAAAADVCTFLLMKNVENSSKNSKFNKVIYSITSINLILVVFTLICIVVVKVTSNNSYELLHLYEDYSSLSERIYISTCLFLSFSIFSNSTKASDVYCYTDYIKSKLDKNISLNFDNFIRYPLIYNAEESQKSANSFNLRAFNYFPMKVYEKKINFLSNFTHLEPSGTYSIREENFKNLIGLFILTIFQLSERKVDKIYLNTKLLDYTYINPEIIRYPDMMNLTDKSITSDEKDQFTNEINLYLHLFNFYNAYSLNLDSITNFLNEENNNHFKSLHKANSVLIIVLMIVNIIFLFLCLLSIMLYKRILKTEFVSLYGLSEDNISKLNEKYQYVKELIKRAYAPSGVYRKIKKMRESIEEAMAKSKARRKKRENKEQSKIFAQVAGGGGGKIKRSTTEKDNVSVMTSGSTTSDSQYLQFSGGVKGLYRSGTLKAKQHLSNLSKESRKLKASKEVLDRLNFDFEIVKKFITFIIFVSAFYIVLGTIFIIVSYNKYDNILIGLKFVYNFIKKFENIYNFFISIKLSILFNKEAPYTLYMGNFTSSCRSCVEELFDNYSLATSEVDEISNIYPDFKELTKLDEYLSGDQLCESLYYKYNSSYSTYLLNSYNKTSYEELKRICEVNPILNSNIKTAIIYILFKNRKVYSNYLVDKEKLKSRLKFLNSKFRHNDILLISLVNPYYEYYLETYILGLNLKMANKYFTFMYLIYIINLIIDGIMILFIWFKVYKVIIKSVESVQLVNDAISVI